MSGSPCVPPLAQLEEEIVDAERHYDSCRLLAKDAAANIYIHADRLEGFRRDQKEAAWLLKAARERLHRKLREKGDN